MLSRAHLFNVIRVLAPCLAAVLLTATCNRPPSPPAASAGPTVVLRNSKGEDWTVKVELARTPLERQKGLMYRYSLEKDHGMLFIFEDVRVRSFWMKNTRIPLDMIFIGEDRRIAGIVRNAEPYSENSRTVGKPSKWVLEVGGGQCEAHGIADGDLVYIFGTGDK